MSDNEEGQNVPLDAGLDRPETPDVTEGREKTAAAGEVEPASDDPYIAALLREREGYVAFGKKERVAAVDGELKRRGHKPGNAAPKGRAPRESMQATADAPVKETAGPEPEKATAPKPETRARRTPAKPKG